MDSLSPEQRSYNIPSGRGVWHKQLIEDFPKERAAIDRFFQLVQQASKDTRSLALVKVLPQWLVNWANRFGITSRLSSYFALAKRSTQEVVEVYYQSLICDYETIQSYCMYSGRVFIIALHQLHCYEWEWFLKLDHSNYSRVWRIMLICGYYSRTAGVPTEHSLVAVDFQCKLYCTVITKMVIHSIWIHANK